VIAGCRKLVGAPAEPVVLLDGMTDILDLDWADSMMSWEDRDRVVTDGVDMIVPLDEDEDVGDTDGFDPMVRLDEGRDPPDTDGIDMKTSVEGGRGLEDVLQSEVDDSVDSFTDIVDNLDSLLDDGGASSVDGDDSVGDDEAGDAVRDVCGARAEPTREGEVPFVIGICRRIRAMRVSLAGLHHTGARDSALRLDPSRFSTTTALESRGIHKHPRQKVWKACIVLIEPLSSPRRDDNHQSII
jgi:hypothetical protein